MKILIIKLIHLGDTLLLTPTLDYLGSIFPTAQIDIIVRTGSEEILKGHPSVTNIIALAAPERKNRSFYRSLRDFLNLLRKVAFKRYDYAFDLSNSDRAKFWIFASRSKTRVVNNSYGVVDFLKKFIFNKFSNFDWVKKHRVLKDFHTVCDIFDPNAVPGPLSFYPQVDEQTILSRHPYIRGLAKFAVIHPTSRWIFKEWVPERWAQIADFISEEYGFSVLFSCGPDLRECNYVTQIMANMQSPPAWTQGKTSFHELGWIFGRARLFVGVDTFAMHLASAMQTPIVALFGPSSEIAWHPWKCRHEIVLGDCQCKQTRKFICDKSMTYPCMDKISVESVKSAIIKTLSID